MPALAATVGTIAARLDDIATGVAAEAAQLTRGLRAIGDHTRDITVLAADLERAAQEIDDGLQGQLHVIAASRDEFAENGPALAALATSAEIIASMSARIRDIAARSRMLSFNARIEAARGAGDAGFSVVAEAMGQLAAQTRATTDDIDGQAARIAGHVTAAGGIIQAGTALADRQHAMIGAIAATTTRQRCAARELRRLTTETVERVDDAALGIGRVSSAASIVGVLARQMTKLAAGPVPEPVLHDRVALDPVPG